MTNDFQINTVTRLHTEPEGGFSWYFKAFLSIKSDVDGPTETFVLLKIQQHQDKT